MNAHTRNAKMTKLQDILICENCGEEQLMVIDSRTISGIRRRRHSCSSCGNRTTTYEISASDFEKLLLFFE